jgi:hypothetical protein
MDFSLLTIVLLPTALVLLLLGFITLNRYIRYKERVALAQLGLLPDAPDWRDRARAHGSRGVLWGGVITATSGLALLLGLGTLGVGVWLLAGFLPLFVGLGMILIYFLTPGIGTDAQGTEPTEEHPPRRALAATDDGGDPKAPVESPGHDGVQSALIPSGRPDKAAKR